MAVQLNRNVSGTETKSAAPQAAENSGGKSSSLSTLVKRGKSLFEGIEEERQQHSSGRFFRFSVGKQQERTITFLDGDLDAEGYLDIPGWREHRVQVDGYWQNIVCVSGHEPCPLCEAGDRPSYVGGLTVIDHSPYKVKNGPNAGKEITNRRMLFVAKPRVLQQLQKLASRRGGLRNWTFVVSRSQEKAAMTGDTFDPITQQTDEDLVNELGEDEAQPLEVTEHLNYLSAAEMMQKGLGKPVDQVGGEPDTDAQSGVSGTNDIDQVL